MTSIFQRCDQKSRGCWREQALSKALRWASLPSSWWYQASAPSPFIWRWATTLLQLRYAHKGSVACSCGGFICMRNTHVVFVPDSTHSSTGFHCGCCFQFHDLCPQSHTPGSQVAVRRCCRHQKVSGENWVWLCRAALFLPQKKLVNILLETALRVLGKLGFDGRMHFQKN